MIKKKATLPKPAPDSPDELKKWASQIRKGSLEMCLLGVIAQGPRYGFEIVQSLSTSDGLAISEGTLYPLLNRLQNADLIEAAWQESDAGPPRKYYSLTSLGKDTFLKMRTEWRKHAQAISTIVDAVH